MSGRAALPVQPVFEPVEESEDRAGRVRFWVMALFVALFAAASLAVYLWMRPANRHFEPTPYEGIITQLRSNMTESDVLTIFRNAKDGVSRADYSAFDETAAGRTRRVLAYRVGVDDPLKVRLGGPAGNTVAE